MKETSALKKEYLLCVCVCVCVCVQREQEEGEEAPYLLPRKTFSQSEEEETQYLRDVLGSGAAALNTTAQVIQHLTLCNSAFCDLRTYIQTGNTQ